MPTKPWEPEQFRPTYRGEQIERASAQERGYTFIWHRVRDLYLGAHPVCQNCKAQHRTVPATVVHHIIPKVAGGGDEDENLMALCRDCHARATGKERRVCHA